MTEASINHGTGTPVDPLINMDSQVIASNTATGSR